MRERTNQRSDSGEQTAIRIPWDASTIGVLREFLAERAVSARLYLKQLRSSKEPDAELIGIVACELRIARRWQRQLVSEAEFSVFTKEEYCNDKARGD